MLKSTLLLGFSLMLSATAFAQDDAVVPSTFRINNIQSNGDACQPGSVAVNISDDKEAFTVSFSNFVAELGPGATNDNRRACRLVFDTEQDAGWEFGVLSVTARGFAQLDEGVVGTQDIMFGAKNSDADTTMDFTGPYAADYVHAVTLPFNAIKWSGCGANAGTKVRDFAVKATAILKKTRDKTKTGLMTVDTVDGQLEHVYELAWHKCSDKKARYLASCQVQGQRGNSISVQGMGRTAAAASAKANAHLVQRCAKVKDRFGACDQSVAKCTVNTF